MKFALLACIALGALPVLAQDTTEPLPEDWNIHAELSVFAGKAETLYPIANEFEEDRSGAKPAARLKTLQAEGSVRLAGKLIARTLDNNGTEAWQGEEVRFGTQFSKPTLIERKTEPKTAGPPKGRNPEEQSAAFTIDIFETRKVGLSLSLDARVSADGKRLIVHPRTNRTWLVKWDEVEVGRLANKEKLIIKQPRFATVESSPSMGINSGEHVLISIHPVPESADQVELMILRVWTTPRKTR